MLQTLSTQSKPNTIQALFEERVRMSPNSPAVHRINGECWSYSELNAFANRVAHGLLRRGIVPEQRIGVSMERSPETIGVLLGILKARAAYVPLDINLPAERLRYICEDAGLAYIFADAAGQVKLLASAIAGVEILAAHIRESLPEFSPELHTSSHDLANILYTSGSTGKPKGAMLEHAAVTRLVRNTKWLRFLPRDIFLQISALSFDISNFEVWGPLLNGGSVVTVPHSPSIGEIKQLLDRFNISTLWLTAGLFNVVMEERPEAISRLKYLLTGGDVASPRHASIALKHFKGQLLNCYGPTENATFSTFHRVRSSDTAQPSIPIGTAIDKSSFYVLDESMNPVQGTGVGEIFVGGEGLSRGYWNQPGLTAERFRDVEIRPKTVVRLYRTGDLGRINHEGLLEFVGRTDFQVKIRGFRIEPEEIELALSSMPGLAAAAIITRGESAESKQLYCCYVRESCCRVEVGDIRSFLATKFPDYMIPTFYRELASLPRNTNEKVDRRALERMFQNGHAAGECEWGNLNRQTFVLDKTARTRPLTTPHPEESSAFTRGKQVLQHVASGCFAVLRKMQPMAGTPRR